MSFCPFRPHCSPNQTRADFNYRRDRWSGPPAGHAASRAACLRKPRHAGSKAVVAGQKRAPRVCYNLEQMLLVLLAIVATSAFAQAPAASLDLEFFKTRVQPIFLAMRPGNARCYVCHSIGTPFRLQRL